MDLILDLIARDIKASIDNDLQRLGVMYRLFARIKTSDSIEEKVGRKKYDETSKKMQDVIGFRIITYFYDDVRLLFDFFNKRLSVDNFEFDEAKKNVFEPLRKNLVCRFTGENEKRFADLLATNENYKQVDSTFEIQFRTTFSEGWHEVEHNMRYKCRDEWQDLTSEWRTLNGMYAVMETSDQALKSLFEDISYQHYKKKNWEAMLRNKYRLRFKIESLQNEICDLFNNDNNIAKSIFKSDRQKVLRAFIDSDMIMKMSMTNLIFLINHLTVNDKRLEELTPQILKDDFETYLKNVKKTKLFGITNPEFQELLQKSGGENSLHAECGRITNTKQSVAIGL